MMREKENPRFSIDRLHQYIYRLDLEYNMPVENVNRLIDAAEYLRVFELRCRELPSIDEVEKYQWFQYLTDFNAKFPTMVSSIAGNIEFITLRLLGILVDLIKLSGTTINQHQYAKMDRVQKMIFGEGATPDYIWDKCPDVYKQYRLPTITTYTSTSSIYSGHYAHLQLNNVSPLWSRHV